jgi:hypothetical protein
MTPTILSLMGCGFPVWIQVPDPGHSWKASIRIKMANEFIQEIQA